MLNWVTKCVFSILLLNKGTKKVFVSISEELLWVWFLYCSQFFLEETYATCAQLSTSGEAGRWRKEIFLFYLWIQDQSPIFIDKTHWNNPWEEHHQQLQWCKTWTANSESGILKIFLSNCQEKVNIWIVKMCFLVLCWIWVFHIYILNLLHALSWFLFLLIFAVFCPPGLGLSTVILPILPNQDV